MIGDCLCRLLDASGWDVTREFYYNDEGSQIDNLARSVQLRCNGIKPDDKDWPKDGYCGEYIKELAESFLSGHLLMEFKPLRIVKIYNQYVSSQYLFCEMSKIMTLSHLM